MAQRKKKLTKKRKHNGRRDAEADSDGDFELAAEIKDDDNVSIAFLTNCVFSKLNPRIMS